jgi:hypothetical protein
MGAKVITISIDGGTTNRTLPGNSGELANDAGSIDDTIFGQDFKSSQTGLISWSIKANGLYKGFAGYVAKILKSGTTTAFTDEAMSVVSGKTYKIDAATKNVWDRNVPITVEDNAVDQTANVESINWLFGQITFKAAYTPTGPITVSGSYLPMTQVARANEFTLTQTTNAIDETDYETAQSNAGHRKYSYGLKTVSIDLNGIYASSNGYRAALEARNEMIIEINPDGNSKSRCRGFFKPMNQGQSGNVGDLEKETNKFELAVPDQANVTTCFAWDHAADTTLNAALKDALTAWSGSILTNMKYLPDGTNGVSGQGVLVDVSLKGGLEAMNEFSINLQGCDGLTVVP